MATSVDWNKYGYVFASSYRKKVVRSIGDGPKTPKAIAIETKLRLNHVSSTLSDLEENGIVSCLTPNIRKGKIYDLTRDGKSVLEQLKKMGSVTD